MPQICLIQSALQSTGFASMDLTNHGTKTLRGKKKMFTKFQKAKPEFGTWAACLHGIYILFGIISNVEVM